jgi:hypothetical protein
LLSLHFQLAANSSHTTHARAQGDGIIPGKLRSYRLDSGKFEATSKTSLTWRPPRIQMIFDVQGQGPPFRSGIVTAEAKKVTGAFPPKLETTVLKVDYEDGDEANGGVYLAAAAAGAAAAADNVLSNTLP